MSLVNLKINLYHFYSFEMELAKVKTKFKGTLWEIQPEEENALRRTYQQISKAKKLNVEPIVSTESLKEDYKKMPVRLRHNARTHWRE